MRNFVLMLMGAVLITTLACSDDNVERSPFEATFSYEDLVDAWRGQLDTWRVENTSGHPSYTLHNVDVSLIIDQQNYWLQLTYFSDSLEYQYYDRGYWLWDPSLPNEIYFEMYHASSTQIFDPIRGSSVPDSIDGGGNNPGNTASPDTIMTEIGDFSEREDVYSSAMEYGEDYIRLYDFLGYMNLGDITLDRY